ncbi:MAG: Mfa1 fimbrilin C-terminal domain-containing protein [Muribaculaceae bacterium]|nr:Mfa1 fimbrilin C-terminal domain-containing protein [Muribaculaceae bacterium]
MKLYKWLYGAMALTMLGACSDNDLIPNEDQLNKPGQSARVKGYLGVQIQLPQDAGTRAQNDQFDDGTAEEYSVEEGNVLLLLFKGDPANPGNEKEATFYKAKELTKPFFSNLDASQISASYFAAVPVEGDADDGDEYYALVMLNRDKTLIRVPSTAEAMATEITINGKKYEQGKVDSKFKEFLKITTDKAFFKKENGKESKIFMTNAPLYNTATNSVQYMTKLANNVKNTADEAKEESAGCIYVERAVAKVTGQKFDNSKLNLTFVDGSGNEIADTYTVEAKVEYALTNTNKTSYLIRNVDFKSNSIANGYFGWDYQASGAAKRMIGTAKINALEAPFHGEQQNLVRTYWCVDPNYETEMSDSNDDPAANTDKYIFDGVYSDSDLPFDNTFAELGKETYYCKENTFNVPNMTYNNTTMALFKVTYNVLDAAGNNMADHLYIKDGNKKKIYLHKEDACADAISRAYNSQTIQDALKKSVADGKTLPAEIKMDESIDFEWEVDADNNVLIKTIKIKAGSVFDQAKFIAAITSAKLKSIVDNINALSDVKRYKDCVSYYAIPIEHFGEYYTPWQNKNIKGETTDDVYGGENGTAADETAHKNYLGRFGMVRNNWYDLGVNTITGLGSTRIPNVCVETSDDNIEDNKYLAIEIHMMSWAKRVQNIDL